MAPSDLPGSGAARHDPAVEHPSGATLEAGLEEIRQSPPDVGRVALVVRRPSINEREVLAEGVLDPAEGLVGDTWRARGNRHTADGSAHPDMQVNLMNARAAALVAGEVERWPLAGDQLYVDLDLSQAALPPSSRLAVGSAVIEITDQPHLGCAKFAARFGQDALRFVNSTVGRALRLRGVNGKVVSGGRVCPGDVIRKLARVG